MLEDIILSNLIYNEEYTRKVLPFIKDDYFKNASSKVVFKLFHTYLMKYNVLPSKEALFVDLESSSGLPSSIYEEVKEKIGSYEKSSENDFDWLIDNTEKFCQDAALHNAIMESVLILDGKSKDKGKGAIPKLLSDALGVSFDTSIGHDFILDAEERYDFYHKKETKVPFDIDFLNKITNGGVSGPSLNVIMGSTGTGKSLVMCHMAAAAYLAGYNVLYITLEMSEQRIMERIDANILNIPVQDLELLPKETYLKKISRVKDKLKNKIISKEYPTASASVANFRHLLHELKVKRNMKPDIIFIDYLNICASSRLKMSANVNSYTYVKSIAEEIRGLSMEEGVPIISATQSNRDGANNSDVDITNVSESFGLAATVDLLLAIIATDELMELGQYMFKQLKNRYGDLNFHKTFMVGVDKAKMRLYNVENSGQPKSSSKHADTDTPIMDKGQMADDKKSKFSKLRING